VVKLITTSNRKHEPNASSRAETPTLYALAGCLFLSMAFAFVPFRLGE